MIPISSISDQAKGLIQQKLVDIAQTNNIKILFAIESGSRAWGFPSANSDYDVRFVYARTKDDYLSITQFRDVIETDITDNSELGVPLDLNGWDIRKALLLAVKSNAVLAEWLQSPIRYTENNQIVDDLLKFVKATADLESIGIHYYKLMLSAWEQIEKDTHEVKLKLYCYALRPALALQWIGQYGGLPPMDMATLLKGLIKNKEPLTEEISRLITLKATAKEDDIIPRNPVIDAFIKSLADEPAIEVKKTITIDNKKLITANKFFRQIVGC